MPHVLLRTVDIIAEYGEIVKGFQKHLTWKIYLCDRSAFDKEAARAPGREEEPDRAGQPDNTAQAKNGLVPAGDQAVPGESSKKCLSFSKAA